MTIGARPSDTPPTVEPLDDDFFDSAVDPLRESEPRDAVLERKMSPAVRARRARLTRLVKGAVGCATLLLLVAIVAGLGHELRTASAANRSPTSTERPK